MKKKQRLIIELEFFSELAKIEIMKIKIYITSFLIIIIAIIFFLCLSFEQTKKEKKLSDYEKCVEKALLINSNPNHHYSFKGVMWASCVDKKRD